MTMIQTARSMRNRARKAINVFQTGDHYRLAIAKFGETEVAYREGTSDDAVLSDSFENDIFLSRARDYVPESDHVILDVGAHIGTFDLLLAPQVKKVFAIEASRESFDMLRINKALNRFDNVTISHLAMAGKNGTVHLHHDVGGNWGHSITKALSKFGEEVRAQTLPSYFEEHGIDRVDFAKFNCEGAEFEILQSTPIDVLQRIKFMVLHYHLDLVEGRTLTDLLNKLHAAGFKTRKMHDSEIGGCLIAQQS